MYEYIGLVCKRCLFVCTVVVCLFVVVFPAAVADVADASNLSPTYCYLS